MCSNGDLLGWRTVENTVSSRMVDLSLIHRLIPSGKLRKRTKALNAALKKLPNINSYSQYVEKKTSILRDLSEDSETDDSGSFSEEDYAIIYKSVVSSTNYEGHASNGDPAFLHEENVKIRKKNVRIKTARKKTRSKTRATRAKPKVSPLVNLGWQSVIKKSNCIIGTVLDIENQSDIFPASTCHEQETERFERQRYEDKDTNAFDDRKPRALSTETDEQSDRTDVLSKEEEDTNVTLKMEIRSKSSSDSEASMFTSTRATLRTNGKDKEESDRVTSPAYNSGSISNVRQKTCSSSSNTRDSDGIGFVSSKREFCLSNVNRINWSASRVACQPKDSGIDEDSQEDSSEYRRTAEKTASRTIGENEVTVQAPSPKLDPLENDVPERFEDISPGDTTKLLDTTDLTNSRDENETHGHKLQPKVMCTEIVSKKYKIILGEEYGTDCTGEHDEAPSNSFNDDSRVSPKVFADFEKHENDSKNVERLSDIDIFAEEHNEELGEDSMPPFAKKRLQQLQRLNLTVSDGSSSSNDDDDDEGALQAKRNNRRSFEMDEKTNDEQKKNILCTAENLRGHRRRNADSRESGDDSEGFTHLGIYSKDSADNVNVANENFSTGEKNKKKKKRREREVDSRDQSQDQIAFDDDDFFETHPPLFEGSDNNSEDSSRLCDASKHSIERANDTNGIDVRQRKRKQQSSNEHSARESSKEESLESNGETNYLANSTAIGAVRKRPCNLQEMIECDELTEKTFTPSIVFKDIDVDEEDIFVFDIPRTILETQLIGEKISLTAKRLKIGKQKYEVFYKNVDSVSCVFGTGKSRKPCKAVNVKPFATVIAGKRIEEIPAVSDQTANVTEVPDDHTEDSEGLFKRKRSPKGSGEKMKGQNKKRTMIMENRSNRSACTHTEMN